MRNLYLIIYDGARSSNVAGSSGTAFVGEDKCSGSCFCSVVQMQVHIQVQLEVGPVIPGGSS